eukprot:1153332-Pelagomonas_calceolata.AAC.4
MVVTRPQRSTEGRDPKGVLEVLHRTTSDSVCIPSLHQAYNTRQKRSTSYSAFESMKLANIHLLYDCKKPGRLRWKHIEETSSVPERRSPEGGNEAGAHQDGNRGHLEDGNLWGRHGMEARVQCDDVVDGVQRDRVGMQGRMMMWARNAAWFYRYATSRASAEEAGFVDDGDSAGLQCLGVPPGLQDHRGKRGR